MTLQHLEFAGLGTKLRDAAVDAEVGVVSAALLRFAANFAATVTTIDLVCATIDRSRPRLPSRPGEWRWRRRRRRCRRRGLVDIRPRETRNRDGAARTPYYLTHDARAQQGEEGKEEGSEGAVAANVARRHRRALGCRHRRHHCRRHHHRRRTSPPRATLPGVCAPPRAPPEAEARAPRARAGGGYGAFAGVTRTAPAEPEPATVARCGFGDCARLARAITERDVEAVTACCAGRCEVHFHTGCWQAVKGPALLRTGRAEAKLCYAWGGTAPPLRCLTADCGFALVAVSQARADKPALQLYSHVAPPAEPRTPAALGTGGAVAAAPPVTAAPSVAAAPPVVPLAPPVPSRAPAAGGCFRLRRTAAQGRTQADRHIATTSR